jgi:hypothetical protein
MTIVMGRRTQEDFMSPCIMIYHSVELGDDRGTTNLARVKGTGWKKKT